MEQILVKLGHWWQRNFGQVYATENGIDWYRYNTRLGYIAITWLLGRSFILRLGDDHRLIMSEKDFPAEPYGRWKWDYEPHGYFVCDAGAW